MYLLRICKNWFWWIIRSIFTEHPCTYWLTYYSFRAVHYGFLLLEFLKSKIPNVLPLFTSRLSPSFHCRDGLAYMRDLLCSERIESFRIWLPIRPAVMASALANWIRLKEYLCNPRYPLGNRHVRVFSTIMPDSSVWKMPVFTSHIPHFWVCFFNRELPPLMFRFFLAFDSCACKGVLNAVFVLQVDSRHVYLSPVA